MDHPVSLSSAPPWRAAALVAAGIATLELLVLVVVGLAFVAKPFTGEAGGTVWEPAPAAAPVAKKKKAAAAGRPVNGEAEAAPALPRNETSVIVLNGNGIPGAAGKAASLVRSLEYLIAGTANAKRTDFPRSLVMFRPGYEAEARRLAQDLRVKRVVPLDGMRAADLEGAHVALILGGN